MARQIINLGSSPNKGDGDPIRLAFSKINKNFEELYSASAVASGSYTGDVIGSVFSDDSTIIVNGQTGEITGYVSIATLKDILAQATDFTELKILIDGL